MSYQVRSVKRQSALVTIIVILIVCGIGSCVLIGSMARCGTPIVNKPEEEPLLRIAYSADKAPVFTELLSRFQAAHPKLDNGTSLTLKAEAMDSDDLVEQALAGNVQVISPDSSLWLAEVERRSVQGAGNAYLVGESTRYMVSPIVIAMWSDVAESLGYPQRELGWSDLLRAARERPQFKWSHPSAGTASGMLTTLAIFYAGAGITRGLTEETATSPETLAFVSELEKTVRHYGEAEQAVIAQIQAQGRDYLDAFIIQEQLLISYNIAHPGSLVAIYPVEGTLWADHPLALLETPELSDDQRLAYNLLKEYLLSSEAQEYILSQGFRPADLSLKLNSAASVISGVNGVDPEKPYTTLQMPSAVVIEVIRNAWAYTKRPANIFLVADVSGSMEESDKLVNAREALSAFVNQIPNANERVGLIIFSSTARELVPLTAISAGRELLQNSIANLTAGGNTALLDGVAMAWRKLKALEDTERINAIVVMTDGKENNSSTRLTNLVRDLTASAGSDLPILVFCIAYGDDADLRVLRALSEASGAFTSTSDTTDITELYKTLSTYF